MYTYDQFLELDSETQLALVQTEGRIIVEQRCSDFHSIIYGLQNFNVELVDDMKTGKVKINRTYRNVSRENVRPVYYK
ncbi:hypothetical protein [Chryseobacterium foetidum]|uniref:hypothetical protein n=1 Tax=Chryseobacterium foetidum TaxID=2951057 RepID=UPI0021C66C19|nr:hypothetical protein [Chryseobacterium foetidum]